MKVTKVGGYIGADISGVDIANCKNEQTFDEIKKALYEHGVIFFRDQKLSLNQYIDFGKRFGELFINNSPSISAMPDYPELEEIRKEPNEKSNIGDEWHTDQAYRDNPCIATILYGCVIPPHGGDTSFTSTASAYEQLADNLKDEVESLKAVNSHIFLLEQTAQRTGDPDGRFVAALKKASTKEAIHPVVTIHPETGRKCLYVNPAYTSHFVGRTRERSIPLLEKLYKHVLKPEFSCRFRWQKNSIAIWDNRQVWHYAANDYQGQQRLLYRMVVQDKV